MSCPSCGHDGMLFENHNGMEHNVCENCGTVTECASFAVDTFQKGCQDVPTDYDAKPGPYRYGRNPKSKAFGESKDLMTCLMDRLHLPTSVKETAFYFFQHSRYLDKLGSIGACVYLAMKYNNIPITIRYLSNYLQISEFVIGRMMKKLEKRIGYRDRGQSSAFSVETLIPLIFNQAKLGGEEDGKKRLKLLLDKTERFVKLLQECQVTTGCKPHLVILAAGYIVWRHLISHNWYETAEKDGASQQSRWTVRQMRAFLDEIGITLSNPRTVHSKVNIIIGLLYKLSLQIPWISARNPSKDIIFYNLDDFLNYKSQIIELTAQEMSNECSESEKVEVRAKGENFSVAEYQEREPSLSVKTETVVKGGINHEGAPSSSSSGTNNGSANESVFQIDLSKMGVDKNALSKQNKSVFRRIKYTRVTDIIKANFQNVEKNINVQVSDDETGANCSKSTVNDECVEQSSDLNRSNGFSKLVKFTHPYIGRVKNRKLACKNICNPDLSFT